VRSVRAVGGEYAISDCHLTAKGNIDAPITRLPGRRVERKETRFTGGRGDYIRKEAGSEHYDLLAHRIRNVVGQRRAEKAKKARNRRIRRVYERINDVFAALDEEMRVTDVKRN
jgi:hypothetical protein